GIAAHFDSHAHGIDWLETPQVVGSAERYRSWLAIPNNENGEPYEGQGESNGDRKRDANARAHQPSPPRTWLTEHTLFERGRSIRNLPFMQQMSQPGIVAGFHKQCFPSRVAGRASSADSHVPGAAVT